MVRLENDLFLNALNELYEKCRTRSAVTMTMCRRNMKTKPNKRKGEAGEFQLLVRASDSKKRISTVVSIAEYKKFHDSFMTIVKAHSDGLKEKRKEGAKAQ